MSDSPIEGLPQQPSRYEQKSEADTEKFKRMMKVDESDETQKRHKRTKQEEEEEEEKVEDEKTPHVAFSELMGKPKKGDNIFDVNGGIEADLTPTEEGPVTASRSITSSMPTPPIKTEEERKEKEEKEQRRAKKIETEAAAAKTQEQKEKEEIKRLELPVTTTPTPVSTVIPAQEEEEEEAISGLRQEEAELASTAIPTEAEKEEEEPAPFPSLEEEKTELSSLKKKPEEQKKREVFVPPPAPPPTFAPTPIERFEAPSYATLNSEIFELFERLIGLMMIEQTKGVSTTTVTLNMPGSIFNGSQIVLEHYSTAPNSFNIELRGSPEAVQLFADNMTELAASFQGSKLAFTVHLRTPVLLEEHRPLIRRKEKPGEKKPDE